MPTWIAEPQDSFPAEDVAGSFVEADPLEEADPFSLSFLLLLDSGFEPLAAAFGRGPRESLT